MSMTRSSHPVTTASRFILGQSGVLLHIRQNAVTVLLLPDQIEVALDVVADAGLDAVVHRSVFHRSLLLTPPAVVISVPPTIPACADARCRRADTVPSAFTTSESGCARSA